MFKIFYYKQLAFVAVILSAVFLLGATVNVALPVFASGEKTVKLPVVMYHQISENKNIIGDYVIPLSVLEEDFLYIKENGITPISLSQAQSFLKSGKDFPEKPIILTFDDGEKSFLTKVVPLMEKYGYPANINIIGSLTELYTKSGENDDRYAYLNEGDIKKLSENSLVEIGCHTYNMHSLSTRRGMGRLSGESETDYLNAILQDFSEYKRLFEKIGVEAPKILAYPYGIRNDLLLETSKKEGFEITLTCRESVNNLEYGEELYELGRFNRPFGKGSRDFFNKLGY